MQGQTPAGPSATYTEHLKHEDFSATHEASKGKERLSFILVADGHGGSQTASYLQRSLLCRVEELAADGSAKALHDACVTAFAEAHEAVKLIDISDTTQPWYRYKAHDPQIAGARNLSGATLTVVIFNHMRRELTCANVGDSQAALVHESGFKELTVSHRLADNIQEQARLEESGVKLGRALDSEGWPGGPLRAWPGGLAVTRGIGDADCEGIVSCVPSVVTFAAPEGGGVVVAASDGVWDSLRITEAVKLVQSSKVHACRALGSLAAALERLAARLWIFGRTAWLVLHPQCASWHLRLPRAAAADWPPIDPSRLSSSALQKTYAPASWPRR